MRSGSARVNLPAGLPGAEVLLHARVAVPDPESPEGVTWMTSTESVVYGEVEYTVEGVELVYSGGEPSLDVPAVRTGGSR